VEWGIKLKWEREDEKPLDPRKTSAPWRRGWMEGLKEVKKVRGREKVKERKVREKWERESLGAKD